MNLTPRTGFRIQHPALLGYASFADLKVGPALELLGLGLLLALIAVAVNAGRLVRPLASVLGQPAARFGGAAGELARDNATRNPARTASTAAALMIGLALVALVATLASGLRNSDKNKTKGHSNE